MAAGAEHWNGGVFHGVPVWAQGNIVDTAHVEQAPTRGAIVWDAREAADYAEGHIPGAVNFGWVASVPGPEPRGPAGGAGGGEDLWRGRR